jgi:hypothetical protein
MKCGTAHVCCVLWHLSLLTVLEQGAEAVE